MVEINMMNDEQTLLRGFRKEKKCKHRNHNNLLLNATPIQTLHSSKIQSLKQTVQYIALKKLMKSTLK